MQIIYTRTHLYYLVFISQARWPGQISTAISTPISLPSLPKTDQSDLLQQLDVAPYMPYLTLVIINLSK